jgi:hypothetical protein
VNASRGYSLRRLLLNIIDLFSCIKNARYLKMIGDFAWALLVTYFALLGGRLGLCLAAWQAEACAFKLKKNFPLRLRLPTVLAFKHANVGIGVPFRGASRADRSRLPHTTLYQIFYKIASLKNAVVRLCGLGAFPNFVVPYNVTKHFVT